MIATRKVNPTPSAYSYPLLIKNILAHSLTYEPDNEIVYRDLHRMNYRSLHERIAQLAHGLTKMGVKPGDVVGVMEFDSHRYLELYFAVPMIGAVLHTINFRLSREQMLYTINHAEDKVIFCNEAFQPVLESLLPELDTTDKYIFITDEDHKEKPDIFFDEYENLIKNEPKAYDFPDFDEDTMATLFYTTGTTGLPKGVCFSHQQLVLHTIAVAASLSFIDSAVQISSNDVYFPLTPMFHVHAWGMPYVATMFGMKQVYPGKYEPEMLLKLIVTHKVTFSHSVPTILNMLISSPVVKTLDLSNYKFIIGGSALPYGLVTAAMDLGINVIAGYGMSETCPVLTLAYLPNSHRGERSTKEEAGERIKTGRPVAFVDLKLMDDDGKFLPFDGKAIGEIVVRAPWLTQCYFKEEERSEELWKSGYLHTGDMAWVESNGTVVIVDRKKDVIKSGGEWISSLELENIISEYAGVKEAAVVGIPDEKWTERPVAMVVIKEGQDVTSEVLKAHIQKYIDNGRISKWAMPDQFIFVKEIPKTSVGKIDKKEIRKSLQS